MRQSVFDDAGMLWRTRVPEEALRSLQDRSGLWHRKILSKAKDTHHKRIITVWRVSSLAGLDSVDLIQMNNFLFSAYFSVYSARQIAQCIKPFHFCASNFKSGFFLTKSGWSKVQIRSM